MTKEFGSQITQKRLNRYKEFATIGFAKNAPSARYGTDRGSDRVFQRGYPLATASVPYHVCTTESSF